MALTIAAGFLVITPADAQPVENGSWSFSGDPGDWISLGGSYAYSTAANDRMTVSGNGNVFSVGVQAANGDWWDLTLAAPSGTTLTPGTYTGATRYPFQSPQVPGLSHSGNGRGCNQLTGSFTVINATFGPHGYVHIFDATYEQHCEGGEPALRGEIHIANPPPPPVLALDVSVATDGVANKINGNAHVTGEVTCNVPVTVHVSANVTEVVRRTIVRGSFAIDVACTPGGPVDWTGVAVPTGTTPFQRGKAEVITEASAVDPVYEVTVRASETTVVTLRRG